jgi:PAS domain S-box-containing protein
MTSPDEQLLPRMALEALPLGVYVVNREGKIVLWSAGAEQLTGYLRQDVLGRLCEEALLESGEEGSKDAQGVSIPLPETLREGRAVASQLSLRSKSGRFLAVKLQTIPLRDDLGRILGAIKIFDPIPALGTGDRRQNKLGAYGCLDAVTGVLNHSMIQAHLKESLSIYAVYPVPFCVICIAIDDLPKLRER